MKRTVVYKSSWKTRMEANTEGGGSESRSRFIGQVELCVIDIAVQTISDLWMTWPIADGQQTGGAEGITSSN